MSELRVTRIVHSCHLIELAGVRVLTDPWFTSTPTYHPGEPVAMTVADLPDLDAVLISHEHYDHCDLDALAGYRDLDVPIFAPSTVVARARERGFRSVHVMGVWQTVGVGSITVTAAPGKHGVPEITFVLQGGGRTVYFGGDTLNMPSLAELPHRFGRFDLALLPTNGLRIRPLGLQQVVMSASEAASLVALLKPAMAIPHHYAFSSGWLGDRMITLSDRDPRHFADAVARLAPSTRVVMTLPGQPVDV